jgi:hypothetical protein
MELTCSILIVIFPKPFKRESNLPVSCYYIHKLIECFIFWPFVIETTVIFIGKG